MLRCPNCGRDNEEGMRFCTNCGTALGAGSASGSNALNPMQSETISFDSRTVTAQPTNWPTTPYSSATPPPATPRTESTQKSKTGLIVGVIVAVLLLGILAVGGIGAWVYYANSGEVVTNNRNSGPGGKVGPNSNNANVEPTPTPTPKQSFEPPTEPTKEGSFTVYANKGWQLSDIAVVPLEEFTTSVDGIVDLDGVKTGVRYAGVKDEKSKDRRIYPEYATGALLMRTRYADGHFSNVMALSAGSEWENLPDERGMLEFTVNDKTPENNGGQFTIKVKYKSIKKQKK